MAHLEDKIFEEVDELEENLEETEEVYDKPPYQKTKKQQLKRYEKSGACSEYWKAALKMVNFWEGKNRSLLKAESSLEIFNALCSANHVEPISRSWLIDNFKTHEDFENLRKKIRRQLEKNQRIVSLHTLR